MKWRSLPLRFTKNFLILSVLASIHFLMYKCNVDRQKFQDLDDAMQLDPSVRKQIFQQQVLVDSGQLTAEQQQQQQQPNVHHEQRHQLPQQLQSNDDDLRSNVTGRNVAVRRYCDASASSSDDKNYVDEVTFITDKNRRIGYCHVPKVASSSWMLVFANLNGFDPFDYLKNLDENSTETLLEEFSTKNETILVTELLRSIIDKLKHGKSVEQSRSDVLDALINRGIFHGVIMNNFAFKFAVDQDPKILNSLYKFIFVRHPFERLVSAYYDKFVHRRDPNFIRAYIYYETPPDLLIKASINRYLFGKETRSNFRINFEKFVKFVIHEIKNKVISYGTYHWMPFTDFCGLCSIDYHFIGKLETLESDVEHIASLFPETKAYKNIFKSKKNSVGRTWETSKFVFSKLPKSLIEELYDVYKLDFLIGGYPYPTEYTSLGKD